MTEVYKDQIYKLMEVVPDFKVANAVVHYDETSPHMHLVGIPVKDGYKNGMKKQVAKSKIFTKESLKTLQDKMRAYCIEKFNEVFVQNATLIKKENKEILKRKNEYLEAKKIVGEATLNNRKILTVEEVVSSIKTKEQAEEIKKWAMSMQNRNNLQNSKKKSLIK